MKRFDIVVAADEARGIAANGDLPWHLPGDLAHFKRVTTATDEPNKRNAVIMGRKTWESIPPKYRPLTKRINVVLTRRESYDLPEDVLLASSMQDALSQLESGPRAGEVDKVFVVGGGAVYAESVVMPECDRVIITRIAATHECDTFFPEFEAGYELESVMGEGSDNGVAYRMEVWKHKIDG